MQNDLSRDQIIRMIREIMEHYGWSASRLARESNISPSTITRALDPNSPFVPSRATVARIVPHLVGVSKDLAAQAAEATVEARYLQSAVMHATEGTLPVIGTIRQGVWIEGDRVADFSPTQAVPIWDNAWPKDQVVAYKLGDDFSHNVHKEGTFVIAAKILEGPQPPNSGAGHEYIFRRRAMFLGSTKIELSIWRFVDEDGERRFEPVCPSPGAVTAEPGAVQYGHGTDIVGRIVGFYDRRPA